MMPPPTSENKIDLDISDLLKVIDNAKLFLSLNTLLGGTVRITNKDGAVLYGDTQSVEELIKKPLRIGIETLGYIEADTDDNKLDSAVFLIQLLLKSLTRFEVANMLHQEMSYAPGIEISTGAEEPKLEDISHSLFASFSKLSSCINVLPEFTENLLAFRALISSCEGSDALTIAWEEGGLNEGLRYMNQKSNEALPEVEKLLAYVERHSNLFSSIMKEEMCDINRIIENICSNMYKIISRKIKIDQDLKPIPGFVCFPKLLYSSLSNTLLDIVKSLGSRGTISIQTGIKEITDEHSTNSRQIYIRIKNGATKIMVDELLRAVISRYNGVMDTVQEDNQYIFSIYLPLNRKPQAIEY